MTHAVCLACGNMKFGCWVPCKECGKGPHGPLQIAYSIVYSDHHFDLEQLEEISQFIRENGTYPALSPEDEKRALDAYGRFGGKA